MTLTKHIQLALITPDNTIHEVLDLYGYNLDKSIARGQVMNELQRDVERLAKDLTR